MADEHIPQQRTCTKCGETRPCDDFWRDSRKKSGYTSACKECARASNKRWRNSRPDYPSDYRKRRPDVVKAASAKWRASNPDKVREREANRRPRDPEQRKAYNQAYYEQNKDDLNAANRRRYAENAEKRREYRARYYRENPEVIQRWRDANPDKVRQYDAKRRSTPKGRVDDAMSANIRECLKGAKAGWRWEALVGYTVADLMAHLEKHFLDGMSWENYGPEWHIDHVIPKSVFNYQTPEHIDFRRCWGLENLRPLWATANMVKHAKLTKPFQPSLAL